MLSLVQMPHWQPGYIVMDCCVDTFLKKIFELVKIYLGIFLTINDSPILMYTDATLPICIWDHKFAYTSPSPPFFGFCSTMYWQPFLLSSSVSLCWFCLCTWVTFKYKTDTFYIESYIFFPEWIKKFLSLVFANCNLTWKSSALCCPFFLHWINPYQFPFKTHLSKSSVTDIF